MNEVFECIGWSAKNPDGTLSLINGKCAIPTN